LPWRISGPIRFSWTRIAGLAVLPTDAWMWKKWPKKKSNPLFRRQKCSEKNIH